MQCINHYSIPPVSQFNILKHKLPYILVLALNSGLKISCPIFGTLGPLLFSYSLQGQGPKVLKSRLTVTLCSHFLLPQPPCYFCIWDTSFQEKGDIKRFPLTLVNIANWERFGNLLCEISYLPKTDTIQQMGGWKVESPSDPSSCHKPLFYLACLLHVCYTKPEVISLSCQPHKISLD